MLARGVRLGTDVVSDDVDCSRRFIASSSMRRHRRCFLCIALNFSRASSASLATTSLCRRSKYSSSVFFRGSAFTSMESFQSGFSIADGRRVVCLLIIFDFVARLSRLRFANTAVRAA